jgi:mannitol/fructose-specific phosphotransferase system IIA component (Ntr-type)
MKFSQLVNPRAIKPVLEARDRDGVIAELVGMLVAGGTVAEGLKPEIVRLVMERERKLTTGFGRGVAVPHMKHKTVQHASAAIGMSQAGLDFSAPDRQPVYIIFLLLSPEDRPDDHLHAMEVIFRNLANERFRRLLRQSPSPEEVQRVLEEADASHP